MRRDKIGTTKGYVESCMYKCAQLANCFNSRSTGGDVLILEEGTVSESRQAMCDIWSAYTDTVHDTAAYCDEGYVESAVSAKIQSN